MTKKTAPKFDKSALTMGDIMMFEAETGVAFDQMEEALNDPEQLKGKLLLMTRYWVVRQDNPDVTLEEVAAMPIVPPKDDETPKK